MSYKEPRWLTAAMVMALQQESIRRFGGRSGVREPGLLESALARPRNRYAYEPDVELTGLAAAYGFLLPEFPERGFLARLPPEFGLARNPPFVDGNKRIGVLAIAVFLALNGRRFDPDEADEVRTVLALAAGELSEEDLAAWIAANTR